ncbi:MAG TPA: FAD-dependent oxidoreductase [Azospirillaceae bacterium]|nr:FAD-dependent oxidoreductase [Azospirillaceae bacterium]
MAGTAGHVLIVGAGQAGAQAAIALRQKGHAGPITVVGDEDAAPYERPPLSKAYLLGDLPAERLALRSPSFWRQRAIDFRLSTAVRRLDTAGRRAELGDGGILAYDWCILATGGRPRRLECPGSGLAGIAYLRTVADVDGIRAMLARPSRLVIVGGGYLGLEAAAAARHLGHDVVLVEAADRLLARVTSPVVSRFFEDQHRGRGVDIRLGATVAAFEGRDRVEAVVLAGGERIRASAVIVSIGILPDTGIAEAAGIRCEDGVVVDVSCRTSAAAVFAVGDCARHPSRFAGGLCRLESVPNAIGQATVAAGIITGADARYDELPWFWSDQFDLKLRTAGVVANHDEPVVRGDPAQRSFSVLYLREGRLVAIDCINRMRDFTDAKPLIARAASLDMRRLRDGAVPLHDLAETPPV